MTRPSRRVADYAPSTLEFSAELVLAAAVEEAVALLRATPCRTPMYDASSIGHWCTGQEKAEDALLVAAIAADLLLERSES